MGAITKINTNPVGGTITSIYDYMDQPSTAKKRRSDSPTTSDGRNKPRAADPINKEDVQRFKDYLLSTGRHKYRNYMLFVLGINLGRRIGDILKLRICDVYDFKGNCVRDRIYLIEQKTRKTYEFAFLNRSCAEAITMYLNSLGDGNYCPNDYLFRSERKGKNGDRLLPRSAWLLLNNAAEAIGLDKSINIGTHSLRYTCANLIYDGLVEKGVTNPLDITQMILNHTKSSTTIGYLKKQKSLIRDIVMDLNL